MMNYPSTSVKPKGKFSPHTIAKERNAKKLAEMKYKKMEDMFKEILHYRGIYRDYQKDNTFHFLIDYAIQEYGLMAICPPQEEVPEIAKVKAKSIFDRWFN